MKSALLTGVFVWVASVLAAQSVVAAGGAYRLNGGYSLSSTLGEPVTVTLTASNHILTQGFQQPNDQVTRIAVVAPPVSGLEAFPNPANDRVTISVNTAAAAGKLQLRLCDATGRQLQAPVDFQGGSVQNVFTVDLAGLPVGIYLATVYDQNGAAGTMKISKVYN